MKKICISVIILLLLVCAYIMCFKSFSIGKIKIASINNIKEMSNNLDTKFDQATEAASITYPNKINELEEATKKLTTTKEQYETKTSNLLNEEALLATYLKEYKIETLMVDLGRYKNKNNLKDIKMDLKTTKQQDVFDLNLTLVGKYEDIYNFIYNIEDDEELKFEVTNLAVEPYSGTTTASNSETTKSTSTKTTTKTTADTVNIQATFTIPNVSVKFD